MKKNIILPLLILLSLTSCIFNNTDQSLSTDIQLIEAIQLADNKETITIVELPLEIKTVLDRDYALYIIESAKRVSQLGYQVGALYNTVHECIYFTLAGRKLEGNRYRGGESGDNSGPHGDQPAWNNKLPFDFIYPISLLMPDSTTINITSNDDSLGFIAVRTWYLDNPESTQRPQLQFPVDVMIDDSLVTLNSREELDALLETLRDGRGDRDGDGFHGGNDGDQGGFGNGNHDGNGDHDGNGQGGNGRGGNGNGDQFGLNGNDLFDFVFPISFLMPDSSIIFLNNEDNIQLIQNWYADNPQNTSRPLLQYPVDVIVDDETITINSEEEMQALKQSLTGDRPRGRGKG